MGFWNGGSLGRDGVNRKQRDDRGGDRVGDGRVWRLAIFSAGDASGTAFPAAGGSGSKRTIFEQGAQWAQKNQRFGQGNQRE